MSQAARLLMIICKQHFAFVIHLMISEVLMGKFYNSFYIVHRRRAKHCPTGYTCLQ